jgi:hypothetical protein
MQSALRAGNSAVILATDSHLRDLLARLRAQGLDMVAAIGEGRYLSFDVADMLATAVRGDVPDRDQCLSDVGSVLTSAAKAAKGPPPRVAACGEGGLRLCALGMVDAAIWLERLMDELASTHDVEMLCGFRPETSSSAEDVRRICAEHTAVRK